MRKWIKGALIIAVSLLMVLGLGMATTNANADYNKLANDQALETGYQVRAKNCIRWFEWNLHHGDNDPYYLHEASDALKHAHEYARRVGHDKVNNYMAKLRANGYVHSNQVRQHRSLWSKGVPAVLQGNYASYKKSRGVRSMYMIHRNWMSIGLRAGDPMGLGRIYSKKIGYHKYLIHGSNWAQGSYDGFGHSSLIMQRSGRHMYIHYVGANHLQRYYANGSYYKSGYNHMFRLLRSEI